VVARRRSLVFNQARNRVDETDLFIRASEGSGSPKGIVM